MVLLSSSLTLLSGRSARVNAKDDTVGTKAGQANWISCAVKLGANVPVDTLSTVGKSLGFNNRYMKLTVVIGWVESRWNMNAVSPVGAVGAMQVMPAAALHTDTLYGGMRTSVPNRLTDVKRNVTVGMRYLDLAKRECGSGEGLGPLDLMCIASMYNGGYRQLDNWKRNKLLHRETANYAVNIIRTFEQCN